MTILIAQAVMFYTDGDEANFFRWIAEISCLSESSGQGDSIFIECKDGSISADEFLTVYSLFKRYGVDCRQLRAIVKQMSSRDAGRVSRPDAIWHSDIFS